jgi:UDP-N-acetyl-D-glucosamine/UDP-N-acetyl-D-galactosamine dehydrogenase
MEKICVIGLGYVGLPLAVEFGKKQPVVGFDINPQRVQELNTGYDRTLETTAQDLKAASQLRCSTNEQGIADCTIYIITVPTPIDERNQPDLTPIVKSTEMVGKYLKAGDLVIYESTVYPGVTEEVCVPILEKQSGLVFNTDFVCGYSPERINPGDKERTLTKIMKITSGSTPQAADRVDALYRSIITAGTYKAPSIKVAEAAKVIENTQRDIAIATVNELALIFNTMGIDTRQVIEAAATKWNFIKLFPGLVGGHCIGVDPYYLAFKATENGYTPNLILGARQINNGMASFLVEKTVKLMIKADKKINGSNVLILGVTFKEDCPDLRNTKVIDIIEGFKDYGCNVDVWDPWVNPNEEKRNYNHGLIENPFISEASQRKKYDSILLAVAHRQFKELSFEDYKNISTDEPVLIDVKGIMPNPTWRL